MENRGQVQAIYRAFSQGDMPGVMARFDPGIEWQLAESHVYGADGAPFRGVQEVTEKFFARIAPDWEGFVVSPAHFHDAGDTIIVQGRYTGVHKRTQRQLDAQFCHLWTLRAGKVIRFQQYMDTAQLRMTAGVE
jgi:ketosteroid isomerase-like protein